MPTPGSRKNFTSHPWFAALMVFIMGYRWASADPLFPPVPAPTNRTNSNISPALSNVQRLTEEARRLRFSGTPGWRSPALQIIGQAVDLHGGVPLDDLRQEAIHALATADLGAEPWTPKNFKRLLAINLSRETYLGETMDDQIVVRGLQDHRIVWQSPFGPSPAQWLGHDRDHQLDLWLRGGNQFEMWDPTVAAIRSWTSPAANIRNASFNWTGDQVALIQIQNPSGMGELWLAPVRSLNQLRKTKVTVPVTAAEWAPDNVRLAVLSGSPPQVLIYETGTEVVSSTVSLPSRPNSAAWLPNARDVLVGTDGGLFLANSTTAELHSFPGVTNVLAVAIHESGTLALTSGRDGPIQLWDVAARQLLAAFPKGGDRLEFSEDGRRASVINRTTDTGFLLTVATGRDVVQFVPEDRVRSFPGKPDGLRLMEHSVELSTGSNAPVQLPAPAIPASALRSVNGRWVRIRLTDGRTQDWNLEKLRERLATLGIPW